MYSNDNNIKKSNFQRGLISKIKNLFSDSNNNENNQVSEETLKHRKLLIELKESGELFVKNYFNYSNIDSSKTFNFKNGYNLINSMDIKYCTLEEKKSFLMKFEKEDLAGAISSLISNYSQLISRIISDITHLESNQFLKDANSINTFKSLEHALSQIRNLLNDRKRYFEDNLYSCKLGLKGEKLVNDNLDMHSNLINLKNIRLKDSLNRECQCDNIIINRRGIFIVEVKNYAEQGQYSIKIDSSGRWSMKSNNGIHIMNNPVEQNNRHLAILNSIIKDNILLDISAHGVISIANETVDIINESKDIVVRPSSLYNIFDNAFTSDNLSENDISKVQKFILEHSLRDKKYPILRLDEEFTEENIKKFKFLYNKAKEITENIEEFEGIYTN